MGCYDLMHVHKHKALCWFSFDLFGIVFSHLSLLHRSHRSSWDLSVRLGEVFFSGLSGGCMVFVFHVDSSLLHVYHLFCVFLFYLC